MPRPATSCGSTAARCRKMSASTSSIGSAIVAQCRAVRGQGVLPQPGRVCRGPGRAHGQAGVGNRNGRYRTGVTHTSAPIVVKGKVISGRTCGWETRCFIAAHDAETGQEVWRFWTAAQPGTPEDKTWAGSDKRDHISPWGAPGSYDPVTGLYYVGTGVPAPYPRIARHNGNPDAVPRGTPAELYSNSTLALDPETGKLAWYYQHLPGDDWDQDFVHERLLIDTVVEPDPKAVEWINPAVSAKPERRKIVMTVGDPGGLFALDRQTGKFLWASAFPEKVPEFFLSHIVPETGQAFINWNAVHKDWGTNRLRVLPGRKGLVPDVVQPDYQLSLHSVDRPLQVDDRHDRAAGGRHATRNDSGWL